MKEVFVSYCNQHGINVAEVAKTMSCYDDAQLKLIITKTGEEHWFDALTLVRLPKQLWIA